MKQLGLIVNPIAGMGGRVGLKGTDGTHILQQAQKMGAKPQAQNRTLRALRKLHFLKDSTEIITYPGDMGEDAARRCGYSPKVIGEVSQSMSTAEDTRKAAQEMRDRGVDLLLFAGGDGTARDIYNAIASEVVVLGIPAGVKIHSAVYAQNPERAGELAAQFIQGRVKSTLEAEVMDVNEEDFRKGILSARLYGYLRIPSERRYLQSKKAASLAHEKYAQEAIAFGVVENMSEDYFYLIGPGTTTKAIMENLGLENSLLGIDLIHKRKLVGKDLNEDELLHKIKGQKIKLIITPIGGQGYLLGRGNQQISPDIIKQVGKDNFIIISTKQKINSLLGRPLLIDTGDKATDKLLSGYFRIITGYREAIIYKVSD